MTPIANIIAAARPIDSGFETEIPADWLQGRTAYGGLSAALALHAALGLAPDLPPLRSAQVSFIGPLSGRVSVTATLLRRGRNAAFIQADVTGEAGLGFRATYVFMAALDSTIAHDEMPPAPVPRPDPDAKTYIGPDNFFTGNFEFVDQKQGLGPAEWLRWARLRDRTGLHPMVELMAIGDGLPPAAFKLLDGPKPLSSLNWLVNFVDPRPVTEDGWWLLHAGCNRAEHGFSSQDMTIWNAAGRPIARAMQGVAIFG